MAEQIKDVAQILLKVPGMSDTQVLGNLVNLMIWKEVLVSMLLGLRPITIDEKGVATFGPPITRELMMAEFKKNALIWNQGVDESQRRIIPAGAVPKGLLGGKKGRKI